MSEKVSDEVEKKSSNVQIDLNEIYKFESEDIEIDIINEEYSN